MLYNDNARIVGHDADFEAKLDALSQQQAAYDAQRFDLAKRQNGTHFVEIQSPTPKYAVNFPNTTIHSTDGRSNVSMTNDDASTVPNGQLGAEDVPYDGCSIHSTVSTVVFASPARDSESDLSSTFLPVPANTPATDGHSTDDSSGSGIGSSTVSVDDDDLLPGQMKRTDTYTKHDSSSVTRTVIQPVPYRSPCSSPTPSVFSINISRPSSPFSRSGSGSRTSSPSNSGSNSSSSGAGTGSGGSVKSRPTSPLSLNFSSLSCVHNMDVVEDEIKAMQKLAKHGELKVNVERSVEVSSSELVLPEDKQGRRTSFVTAAGGNTFQKAVIPRNRDSEIRMSMEPTGEVAVGAA